MAKTPKEFVKKLHPEAVAEKFGNGWTVYVRSKPSRIEVEIGVGMSAQEAWADAARTIRATPKP